MPRPTQPGSLSAIVRWRCATKSVRGVWGSLSSLNDHDHRSKALRTEKSGGHARGIKMMNDHLTDDSAATATTSADLRTTTTGVLQTADQPCLQLSIFNRWASPTDIGNEKLYLAVVAPMNSLRMGSIPKWAAPVRLASMNKGVARREHQSPAKGTSQSTTQPWGHLSTKPTIFASAKCG